MGKTTNRPRGQNCYNSKLSVSEVREIRRKYDTDKWTQSNLARIYRVSQSTIGSIINLESWLTIDGKQV